MEIPQAEIRCEIGTKVQISWAVNTKFQYQYGIIVGYELITIDGTELSVFSPIIELENGEAIGGWECWWTYDLE